MYSSLKAKMEYKTGPPAAVPKLRCRSMKWMQEAVWCWHIVFTDYFNILNPIYIDPNGTFITFNETNFGNCLCEQGPNGPNT